MKLRRFLIAAAVGLASLFSAYAAPGKNKSADRTVAGNKSLVDLNTASEKDLDALPGVGPATVKKIVDHRPYQGVDDLAKAGLSAKQIEGIRPMVMVGKPSASTAGRSVSKPTPTSSTPPPANPNSKPSPTVAAPPSGSGKVWVNTETKVYHR